MRRPRTILILSFLALLAGTVMLMCVHKPEIQPVIPPNSNSHNNNNNNGNLKDSICFTEEILPLIQSSCSKSGCHDGTNQDAPLLSNYSNIHALVSPGNPTHSVLYKVLIGNGYDIMPPSGNAALTKAQIQLIYTWIAQGALENIDCGMGCDSLLFTFSGAVNPIVQAHCIGCHSGISPGGGISLSSYANVMTVVHNGKLWGSIDHLTGYSAMPKNGTMLDSCHLRQVKKWIDAGSPNN